MSGIAVIGAGAWGTALASLLATHQTNVLLWGRNADAIAMMQETHRNKTYLADIPLSHNLKFTTNLADLNRYETLLYVAPAQTLATLAPEIQHHIKPACKIILCAKGIDANSGRLLHEEASTLFKFSEIYALSGPSFAMDVAKGLPTAVSLAGPSLKQAQEVAEQLAAPRFRIYASDDMAGVEAGGALKNVMALAVGIARGLGLGASAEAALIARGFAELSRIAIALGARAETLSGLSGLGDLVLTCSSPQSRNFAYGMALARSENLANRPLAEGVHTAHIALTLAQHHAIEAPIIKAVVNTLESTITPREAVNLLLERPLKAEVMV